MLTLSEHQVLKSFRNKFGEYLYNRHMIICEAIPTNNRNSSNSYHYHQVCCTNCLKIGLSIPNSQTTTTDYIRHYKKHHSEYTYFEIKEKEMIDPMKNKHIQIQAISWMMVPSITITIQKPGESFDPQIYRKLLTSFLLDSNSPFWLVEGSSFIKLLKYFNAKFLNSPIKRQQEIYKKCVTN